MSKCKNCIHYYKIFSFYSNKWEHVCRMNIPIDEYKVNNDHQCEMYVEAEESYAF